MPNYLDYISFERGTVVFLFVRWAFGDASNTDMVQNSFHAFVLYKPVNQLLNRELTGGKIFYGKV